MRIQAVPAGAPALRSSSSEEGCPCRPKSDFLSISGWPDVGPAPSSIDLRQKQESKSHYMQAMQVLAECIKEAPEFSARQRHKPPRNDGQTAGTT